jgi:hypothetical protein
VPGCAGDLHEIGKLERGDILVTVATDPGWTTVFSIIGGVVVETGGVVAHAVMISREYGLPCVANLPERVRAHPRRRHDHDRRLERSGPGPRRRGSPPRPTPDRPLALGVGGARPTGGGPLAC